MMGRTQQMLETFAHNGASLQFSTHQVADIVDILVDCANTCTLCADACLTEPDMAMLSRCIRLNLDCADICSATSRIIGRYADIDIEVLDPLLEACQAACEACGDECERHGDHMEHCAVCAESCRSCAEACSQLLGFVGR